MLGELFRDERVEEPVTRRFAQIIRGAEASADITGARPDFDAPRQNIRTPEAEGMFRGLRQLVADLRHQVAGEWIDRQGVGLENLTVEPGVTAKDSPVLGNITGNADFKTLDALLAVQDRGRVVRRKPGRSGIGLVGAKKGGGQRQALVQQVPLRADFERAILLGLEQARRGGR